MPQLPFDLTTIGRDAFIERFGDIYEHSPWAAEQVFGAGLRAEMATVDGMAAALGRTVDGADEARKLALLRAHPELAGKLAVRGELTEASSREQAGAGLDQCSPEEFEAFQSLNAAYVKRFGHPFIIAVAGLDRAAILSAFRKRVANTPEIEFEAALEQVHRIARIRLERMAAEGHQGAASDLSRPTMNDPENFWDTRYAGAEGFLFGEAPSVFLTANAHFLKPGGSVLALADGEGRNGVWLAEQGFDVHATDGSSVALDKSRALAARRGVTLRHEHVDLKRWTWPESSYDSVVAIFIQFADPVFRREIFEGMKAAVKPGGVILLHGYRPEQLEYGTGGPPTRANMYDEALLREAFADFEIDRLEAYDAEISEGAGHAGMSALIDLVARRPI